MGYQLRMHNDIRHWLTGLRATEPELARLVGEAVLALIEAGERLGPPLVLPLEAVLQPEDPREALDHSYQRQLEFLTRVRRGVADVATSRKRLELQADQLEEQAARLARQREQALEAGQDALAGEARTREAGIRERLAPLRRQVARLTRDEERLTAASQRLQAKVEEFRIQKETTKATYTAAEASERVRDAFAEMGVDAGEAEVTDPDEDDPPDPSGAAAGGDELLEELREFRSAPGDGAGPGAGPGADVPPPPGLMDLRVGDSDDDRAALLFVLEPQNTAVLVGYVLDPDGSPGGYEAVLPAVTARLAQLRSDRSPDAPSAFTSYDAESFLDEFFPGEETEVETGAGALVARNRAHTLAEARERLRLTQEHVADRMNVRLERVDAIERGEPGATEVRTLAAYVRALGGRLEIIAHIGDEHIILR
jgi:DNA-binding XRE family transcriptional regulator